MKRRRAKRRVASVSPPRIDGLPARMREALADFPSLTAVARLMPRSEGALRKWLRGDSEPAAASLRRFSEITGRSPHWLLFGDAVPDFHDPPPAERCLRPKDATPDPDSGD
jgi:hypothetical protein